MAAKGTFEGLREDLRAVVEAHDMVFTSLTFTESTKRSHGSLNFSSDGQTELPLEDKPAKKAKE